MTLVEKDIETTKKCGKFVVSVIGHSQIGVTIACLFANVGFKVRFVDINHFSLISSGVKPGLKALIKKHMDDSRLIVLNGVREASSASDIIAFIGPTPIEQSEKIDYFRIEKLCKEIGMGLRSGSLIIFEGVTGLGVTESIIKGSLEDASGLKAGKDFGLVYSVTRTFSGQILRDIATYPMVLGAINKQTSMVAHLVLSKITKDEVKKEDGSIP
jgi:UDP-N-acetyl-D-mannosaminuronic acid dehydrogenase